MPNISTNPEPISPYQPVAQSGLPDTKWYKQPLAWILITATLLVLVAAVAVLAYVVVQKSKSSDESKQAVTTITKPVMEPQALIYTTSTEGKEVAQSYDVEEGVTSSCVQTSEDVYYHSLNGSETVKAVSIDDFQLANTMDAYGSTVVLATSSSCASAHGPSLWISQDSGKTYKKLYTLSDDKGQISSIKLSLDGESVAIGYAPEYGKSKLGNIEVIDIETGAAKILMTAKSVGTEFLVKAYDSAKQTVYYTESCSGCGVTDPVDLIKFTTGGSSSVALPRAKTTSYDVTINHDITRVVRAEYSSSHNSQLSQFVVNEYSLGTGKTTNFAAYTGAVSGGVTRTGYTSGDLVYYSAGKQLMTIAGDGQTAELALVPDKIAQIYGVGKAHIIYRTGDDESGKVVDYDVQSKKATTLYEYKRAIDGIPIGVSYAFVK